MVESEKSSFVKILTATLAIYDKTATSEVIGLWWNLLDRKSTRLNSSHHAISRMPSSA